MIASTNHGAVLPMKFSAIAPASKAEEPMSIRTTAAARQNEMNESIAVVATRTLGTDRLRAADGGRSTWVGMTRLEAARSPKKQTAMERKGPWPLTARSCASVNAYGVS